MPQDKRSRLDKVRGSVFQAILLLMCMVVTMALLGVQKTPASGAIDRAPDEARIVLVFPFIGDAGPISGNLVVLADLHSRFGDSLRMVGCRGGEDPRTDRRFPIDEQTPTLFIVTGQDTGQ